MQKKKKHYIYPLHPPLANYIGDKMLIDLFDCLVIKQL